MTISNQLSSQISGWPAVRHGVEFTRCGDKTVVSLPEGSYLRMGELAVGLLRGLDGARSRDEVVHAWGTRIGTQRAAELLERFACLGLLGMAAQPATGRRRLTRTSPATIQLTLYHPVRAVGVLKAIGVLAASWPVRLLYVVLLCCGGYTTAAHVGDMGRSVIHPSAGMWWHVMLAMAVVNVCHELGHATAVAALGGRPRRMGIALLYYVCPAFFCDVSSSWRLARRDRAVVALAGVIVNAAVACLAVLAGSADLAAQSEFWWRLAFANILTIVLNLMPFLRLDGYLLLLAFVDEPYVRPRAMDDARSWLSHHLWRRRPQPRVFHRWWSVPYGLAAMAFPALLITAMLLLLAPLLFSIGWPGSVIWVLAALLALARLTDGIIRVACPPPAASNPGKDTV